MNFQIGVEIDSNRIIWILNSNRQQNSRVRLTTVADNQNSAVIKLYIKSADKKHLIVTEEISNLPHKPAGDISINSAVSISGKTLTYNFDIDGRILRSGTRRIGKYTRSCKPFLFAAVITAVIAALCAAVILLFTAVPKDAPHTAVIRKSPAVPVQEVKNTTEIEKTNTEIKTSEEPPAAQQLPVEPAFIESEITDKHSVYFEPESSTLTRDAITGLGSFIKELPAENDFNEGSFMVEVRGHCARYGTEEGRAELSRERALMVYNFLKTEWKLEADSVITGAGSSEPVTLKKNEQYLNRRVDINIKGNIKRIKSPD